MSKQALSIKWVIIGGSVTIVLNKLLVFALSGPIRESLIVGDNGVVTGLGAMFWVYLALIAVGSYFVGGVLIGYLSPGTTIKEPAAAAVCAVIVNSTIDYLYQSRSEAFAMAPWLFGALVAVLLGLVLGLAGGWLGEKLQGDTLDKMRERGEMPPL
ncbi:MAG: hypothetical protein KJO07_01430 [Deltaproteobacteria bacterium]|jgi:hypothetical protein|nr:hypothetical protein [Deltaproteobacteria bacterium]